jgi:hypothetical protein
MTKWMDRLGTRFEWRRPDAGRRCYYLSGDGEVIASVRFEKSSGTLASLEFGGRVWTCKRTGFWSPRVCVRESSTGADLAVFKPWDHSGGEAVFSTGNRFVLRRVDFWGGEWAFETTAGAEVVRVQGPQDPSSSSGEVYLGLSGSRLAETPVLVVLVWYLRLLMQDEVATSAEFQDSASRTPEVAA